MKDLGMNTVRLEGKMEHDIFYDIADEVGVLVFAGWMCCDSWQFWPEWNAEVIQKLTKQLVGDNTVAETMVFSKCINGDL